MSKVRVHELAKELGVSSKDVLAKLQELGEFVKSASSTVEAPVVRKLREATPAFDKYNCKRIPVIAPLAPSRLRRPCQRAPRSAPQVPAPLVASRGSHPA